MVQLIVVILLEGNGEGLYDFIMNMEIKHLKIKYVFHKK